MFESGRDTLVVGTGYYGSMRVPEATLTLESRVSTISDRDRRKRLITDSRVRPSARPPSFGAYLRRPMDIYNRRAYTLSPTALIGGRL